MNLQRGLSHYLWIVGSFKQIVYRNIEIVGEFDEGGIIGFALAAFVAADAVLIHGEIHGELELRYPAAFSQFFQAHAHPSLDKIIPKRYNQNIPNWYSGRFGNIYARRDRDV